MRCQVDGCYEPAYQTRTLITLERVQPGQLEGQGDRLKIITGWCERHRSLEFYYKNLEEYLRNDPRNY